MENKHNNGPGPGMYQASDGQWYPQGAMNTAPPQAHIHQGGEANNFYGNQPPIQQQQSYGQQQRNYGQQQQPHPGGQTYIVEDQNRGNNQGGGGIGCCGAFFAGVAACCCLDMLC